MMPDHDLLHYSVLQIGSNGKHTDSAWQLIDSQTGKLPSPYSDTAERHKMPVAWKCNQLIISHIFMCYSLLAIHLLRSKDN